jgi:hypothetical protein
MLAKKRLMSGVQGKLRWKLDIIKDESLKENKLVVLIN